MSTFSEIFKTIDKQECIDKLSKNYCCNNYLNELIERIKNDEELLKGNLGDFAYILDSFGVQSIEDIHDIIFNGKLTFYHERRARK